MQSIKVNRIAVFFSGLFINAIVWGIWCWLVFITYETFRNISTHFDLVEINVVGLWVPVGIVGAGLFTLASPLVALITGRRSDEVWGRTGLMIANYIAAFFAIAGIVVAIFFYHLMTKKLEEKGYVYCRSLTTFSAMGRYEVYVAKPELCVKPNKIP
ncbi:hypothetical protein [Aeromonas cavernicola]|uniref:DUF1240 domain-containing protein n=1 Tax=Aeromonas cavernicola TaxID=1006623 RepID=A0A2H9U2J0_9GAMM|nr:hypothetical protein [Aeromonas cavernicola]PJG58224.1 hypothetical protein CUC53_13670 [Aeromonas cavernicola]